MRYANALAEPCPKGYTHPTIYANLNRAEYNLEMQSIKLAECLSDKAFPNPKSAT